MANKKISEFPNINISDASDIFLIDHLGATATVAMSTVSGTIINGLDGATAIAKLSGTFIKKPTTATAGQVLTYNGSTSNWVASAASINTQTNTGASSAVQTLNFNNGLSARVTGTTAEVRLPTATAGQVLTYNGSTSNWVASAASINTQTNTGASSAVQTLNFNNGLSARVTGTTAEVRLPTATAGQVLTYNGSTSNWVASAVSSAMGSTSFTSNNGYTTLSNGLILQWGMDTTSVTTETIRTVTFGIAFPTACLQAFVCAKNSGGGLYDFVPQVQSFTKTTLIIFNNLNPGGGASNVPAIWFAVGH